MVFKGTDNQTFELRIINYQFPHLPNDNWLKIYFNVYSNLCSWGVTDPALTTWELKIYCSDLNEELEKYPER